MTKKKLKQSDLTPPDLEQCQAEIKKGGAFSLGPSGPPVRCTAQPVYILYEEEPGEDGLKGSMTLCEPCMKVFKKQLPDMAVSVVPVSEWVAA